MFSLSLPSILPFLIAVGSTLAQDSGDPYDLSYLKKGAAVGDSYAAGIGAGNQVDWGCSRYDGSYANLVALQLGDGPAESGLDFTYTACSGAVIKGVNDQVSKLSGGQEFIIMSAGGNDADLVGILNSCVYSFWGGLSHPNCDKKLSESQSTIQSSDFASSLDGLIGNAKSKLASDGNIYYVGYAKFFDTTDRGCDSVSWHIWLNIFTREYLTLERRTGMNNLVDLMNGALRDAVSRAGPQVHFIDYDDYVGYSNGRYCNPGQDENSGNGANRQDLFFYEMKSQDDPWLEHEDQFDWHDELRRRSNSFNDDGDVQADNNTLNALYGALIQEAIESVGGLAALEDDNANNDLDAEVDSEEGISAKRSVPELEKPHLPAPVLRHRWSVRSYNGTHNTTKSTGSNHHSSTSSSSSSHSSSVSSSSSSSASSASSLTSSLVPSLLPSPSSNSSSVSSTSSHKAYSTGSSGSHAHSHSGSHSNGTMLGTTITMNNGTTFQTTSKVLAHGNSTSGVGTVVANSTHILLASGQIVSKVNLKKLLISDKTSRVFHPTQLGHSLVANLILYQMAAQNAKNLGIDDFPAQELSSTGEDWPQIGGAACSTDSSDTWASRDPMINAVNSFCSDPSNLRGTAGQSTSGTFNPNSFDYMSISVDWNQTANLGQHSCEAWLDVVTDGCDVPGPDGQNAENLKHGGIIAYDSKLFDATMTITPLVMRRIWDKGQAGGQSCNGVDNNNYLDQATLQNNINDYCQKSAAQPGGIANSGSKFEQVYNDGTPDRVVLTTEWPQGPRNYQIFQDECTYYMGVLNNGCSLPGDNNQMNWKHGGTMSDNNGIKYTITPTQNRPPPPSSPQGQCNADYHWWGYSWDVWGGGFDNSDYGDELRRQVQGCGAVTAWTFDYYDTPEGGVEWHASGTLPLFISSHCLAKAVKSAGGYDSNC